MVAAVRAIHTVPAATRTAETAACQPGTSPVLLGHRPALPAHLAGLQRHHAEDRAHRGGLAGAVRPQEPEDLAGRDAEGQAVQCDYRPEPAAQPDQLEGYL